jgi:lipopolysaccharide export system protein LptC
MTIVRETRLVSGTNVTIPAPELAVSTPNATFSITSRLAIVLKDTLEIRLLAVVKRNRPSPKTRATLHLAVPTVSAEK